MLTEAFNNKNCVSTFMAEENWHLRPQASISLVLILVNPFTEGSEKSECIMGISTEVYTRFSQESLHHNFMHCTTVIITVNKWLSGTVPTFCFGNWDLLKTGFRPLWPALPTRIRQVTLLCRSNQTSLEQLFFPFQQKKRRFSILKHHFLL